MLELMLQGQGPLRAIVASADAVLPVGVSRMLLERRVMHQESSSAEARLRLACTEQ